MGEDLLADCRLTGSRELPGQAEPQVTTHFTARVRLTRNRAEEVTAPPPGEPAGSAMEARDIYRIYFHGPAYQVLERAWSDHSRVVGQMAAGLPANHYPSGRPLVAAPRLIELCFQTAGIWEIGVQGRMGLPLHVDRVTFSHAPDPAEGKHYAVVTPDPREESFDAVVLDARGRQYMQLSGYRTVAIPSAIEAEPLEALHAVMA